MSHTILNSYCLIPIANPNFENNSEGNGWEVVYRIPETFKVSECYLEECERNMRIIQLNSNLMSPSVNLTNHTQTIRSLFSKFKDFEVSNVKFKIAITNRTVLNPIISDYEANNLQQEPLEGTGDITFNFQYPSAVTLNYENKEITLRNMPLRSKVKKVNNAYFWDLMIENNLLFLQLVFLQNSLRNIELTYLNLTEHQKEKSLILNYYLDKLIKSIDDRIKLQIGLA